MVHTASVSMMNGWVPEVAVPAIEEGLRSNFSEAAFTFSDPAEGDEPPVLLHNRPVIAPFESVVTGFRPAPSLQHRSHRLDDAVFCLFLLA